MYLHNVSHQTTVSDNPRHHRSSTDLEQISKFLHRFYAGFVCYSFTSDKLMEKRNVLWHRNWYLKIRIMKVKIQRGRLHWFQQKHCYFKLCRALSFLLIYKSCQLVHTPTTVSTEHRCSFQVHIWNTLLILKIPARDWLIEACVF